MKILADENIPYVNEAFAEFGDVRTSPGRSIGREQLEGVSMLLVRSVTNIDRELLEGTSVRFIASATSGVDHIDTDYLRRRNIGFAHAPGSNADSVAEYVSTAMLNISERIRRTLSSMTIGIVGVGNVGSRVHRHASTLGMKCLLNDPPKKRLTGAECYLPIEEVLKEADIVSLHVPLAASGKDATYHMVNERFVSVMKEGAILINTSRGKVVDERALRDTRNRLRGLILDVWENESVNQR